MASDTSGQEKLLIVRSQRTSEFKSFLAIAVSLCSIHLVLLLMLLMLFALPIRWSLILFLFLLTLMVIPLYETSALAESVARFVRAHGPGHFPITLVVEDSDAFDPKQAYVFAVEPHSVFPVGVLGFSNFTKALHLQKIKGFGSSAIFFTPFMRHIWTWLDVTPISRNNVLGALSEGYSCLLIPGGVREMLYMEHDREVVFLKKRLGFIRIAIEMGAPLVPCFIFGQTRVYKWWKPKGKLYNHMSRALRFAPLVFWGMFGTPIPFPQPLYVAVGKPIEIRQNKQPTEEEVLEVQSLFISAMQQLHERHKADAGCSNIPLNVC
ncbi:hypothetical protein KP509_05G069500 [Ceratopteris richardii]|uniref:Acyltransferase n=1 Tax=Ceratopteris richardii TaxID=49495 RepID=A0A8T2UZD9_CERRI|nr:hypothetical protein KP509_05G069500 [Ceratopteris richardii]